MPAEMPSAHGRKASQRYGSQAVWTPQRRACHERIGTEDEADGGSAQSSHFLRLLHKACDGSFANGADECERH